VKPGNAEIAYPPLATTWEILEVRQSNAATLVVTSATPFDDTEKVARGLCEASHDAGKRTVYVRLGGALLFEKTQSTTYGELALSERETSRHFLEDTLPQWQADHDVIIFDLPALASTDAGAHIVRIADGVVVALQSDRRVKSEDENLTVLLAQLGATITGVVRTSKRAPKPKLSKSPLALIRTRFSHIQE
jgi:hypothetical protein